MRGLKRDTTGYADSYEPADHLRKDLAHPRLRVFVLGDPTDKKVPWAAQTILSDRLVALGVPTVVLDTDMSAQGLDSVVLDNEKGTREAVDHLLRWVEPTSLYFAGGPATNFDTQQRARAFAAALEARGVTPAPGQIEMGDYSLEWGKEWALRMSRKGKLAGAVLAGAVGVLGLSRLRRGR